MLRVLESQAPPKQNATDTITTLSSRLNNATLLEDRRGAILGLRSFAKQYPASVASGALRGLISELTRDLEDVDTEKVVLETLLMLFNPNADSPEADDDIALWLADEFSQRQDNITVLLDLLEVPDFYSRLYALQLLHAISTARPTRTQECILSAPLGTTRLVATLDDAREAVRSAGLLLLNEVTQGSPELQKLVAFENAFERIFNLIKAEGLLTRGGIMVQDCLSLLANLLNLNASNQSLFREMGFVGRLSRLLQEDNQEAQIIGEDLGDDPTRDKNLWGFLAVLRMFLVQGNKGTQANQIAFEKQGLLQLVLSMGFDIIVAPPIRAEALNTCSDIIRGNSGIQERFAHNKVSSPDLIVEGQDPSKAEKVYIIDALLNMTLSVASISMFDVRLAASECIQAYFYKHTAIRHHFLRRAIEGHTSGDDETSNILSVLVNGPRSYQSTDPYRVWFAARIALELLYEDAEAKKMTMAIVEGDAANGEEVVTCIQAVTGNLVACLQGGDDDRICVGYLMFLCGWLFDDADAVDDLLAEGSVVQSFIQATSRSTSSLEIVPGLCAVLLGILYEFSTKDSPIPRRSLQPLLVDGLGRENYIAKLTRLRQHTLVRDFEVLPQNLSSAPPGGLPELYFEQTFVNLIKDNFSRLIRAIDRDPGIEIVHAGDGVGIDRDLVDSLRAQIEAKSQAQQKAESDAVAAERRLGQEEADHRRLQETSKAEIARIKNINEALQKGHEAEITRSETEFRSTVQQTQQQFRRQIEELERRAQTASADAAKRAESTSANHRSDLAFLQDKIRSLETALTNAKDTSEKLQTANVEVLEKLRSRDSQIESLNKDLQILQTQTALVTSLQNDLQQRNAQLAKLRTDFEAHNAHLDVVTKDKQALDSQLSAKTTELTKLQTWFETQKTSFTKLETRVLELDARKKSTEASLSTSRAETTKLEKRVWEQEVKMKQLEERERKSKKEFGEKEEARKVAQTELDDILIVLQDLEERRGRDKKRLKELGAEVSDMDDEDEDDDEDEEEEDGIDDDQEEEEKPEEKKTAANLHEEEKDGGRNDKKVESNRAHNDDDVD